MISFNPIENQQPDQIFKPKPAEENVRSDIEEIDPERAGAIATHEVKATRGEGLVKKFCEQYLRFAFMALNIFSILSFNKLCPN